MTEFNMENYSTEELEKITFSIENEIAKRKRAEQEKLWEEVVKSIIKYCDKYKLIDIWGYCDGFTIDGECNFDTVGIIKS